MGVRRSHALALCGGGALLLLVLARLPHPPAPPAHPAHTLAALAPSATPSTSSPSSSSSPPPAEVTSSARAPSNTHTSTDTHKGTHTNTNNTHKVQNETQKKDNVVYTKDVYEAGHMWVHPELCPRLGAHIRLLVLVTSAPSHGAARQAVRLTWGHYGSRRDVALAFVLGRPPDSMMAQVQEEDALYGDIIMGNSVDSYSNLTLKSLSMLEWTAAYCPRAHRLLKTDDDMFINVPRLLAFIQHPSRVNATMSIWGKVLKKAYPKRIPKSKYYLSRSQYPGKLLPEFATGPAYLVSRDAIVPLLEEAGGQPYVRLEDVFVTGILADRAGVKRHHANEFYNKKVSPHPCAVQRGVAIHMVQYHEQFDLWRKLLDGKTKCS